MTTLWYRWILPVLIACFLVGSRFAWGMAEAETVEFMVEFEGNERLSPRTLRRAIDRPEYRSYTPYLADDLVEAVEDAYHAKGYAEVRVTGEDLASDGGRVIRLEIEEGVRYRVWEVRLSGNQAFKSKRMKEFLRQRRRVTRPPYDRFLVNDDRKRLADFYRSHGYLDVEVTGEEFLDSKTGAVSVHHIIREGDRYLLDDVSIGGNAIYSATDLLLATELNVGEPYNPTEGSAARARILEKYRERGYAYAEVEMEETINESSRSVDLSYRINEGIQVRIGDVHLEGSKRTQSRIIWREVDLEERDLYSRRALFENRKRIFGVGVFSSVEVEPSSPLVGQATTDVTIRVEESKPARIRVGGGYDTEEGPRASLEGGYSNLFGLGHEVGFLGTVTGVRDEEEIYYRDPRVFGSRYDFRGRIYHRFKEEPSYSVDRYGGGFDLGRRYGHDWFLRFSYSLEDLNLEDIEIAPTGTDIPENEGLRSTGGTFVSWDRRDSAFNPHTGTFSTALFELNGGPFGGDFDFVKTELGTALFLPATEQTTLALGVRFGWLEPFGDTDEVPLSEKFLTGGASTIRGFPRNEVGPRDVNGEFIGGDALFIFNAEYRFPIYKQLTAAVFYDTGNVWPDISDFDLGEMRESAGAGLRYISPVGAVRLDYGYVLDREEDEDPWQIHFGVGFAF